MQRLQQQFGEPINPGSAEGNRTFAELVEMAKAKTEQREKAERKQAEDAERRRIEAPGGPKVEGMWVTVSGLVGTGQAKKYDEAVRQVKKLRAIAEKDNKLNAFYARLTEVKEQFSRKKSFISRLDEVGL